MAEIIRIKFNGKLASTGRLNFYDYGRSQYATARFIITIENFRRTGNIAEKITATTQVDVLVESAQRGSFVEDIIVPALQQGAAAAVTAPLSSLIAYVWHLMAPRSEKTDDALTQFAAIRIAELEASVANEQERTRQIEALTSIAQGERATTSQALDLLKWVHASSGNAAVGRLNIPRQSLFEMEGEIEAEHEREASFSEYRDQLAKIDEDTVNRLTSRLRPMVPEMALPLRRSAETLSISDGVRGTTYANITPEFVDRIRERESEAETVQIVGHVKSYDRDAGIGKVTSAELLRVLNFVVPIGDRQRLLDKILEAMRQQDVLLICRRIVDRSGLPTSLILIDIVDAGDMTVDPYEGALE